LGKRERWVVQFFKILGFSTGILLLSTLSFLAQTRKYISRAQIIGGSGTSCPAIFFSFNVPLRYISHFTSDDGRTLSIRLRNDLDATADKGAPDQSGTLFNLDIPGLEDVVVEMGASSVAPILSLRFSQPVIAQVTQSGETSIIVSDLAPAGSDSCAVPSTDTDSSQDIPGPETTTADFPSTIGPGDIASQPIDETRDEIELTFALARIAITEKNYRRATQLLTKLVGLPEHNRSADAQELLGVVRERNGQFAHAKAEYEIYLKNYPDTKGADRVRQRLAAILTAEAKPPKKLRDPGAGYDGSKDEFRSTSNVRSIPRASDLYRDGIEIEAPQEKSTFTATLSQFYYFNQGVTRFREFEIGTVDEDDVIFQNSIVTTLDAFGTYNTENYNLSWRAVGDYELDFNDNDDSKLRFSRIYGDIESKEKGFSLRFGRQTRYDGGIFGRFDGTMLTLPINENVETKFIIGLNVDSTADALFSTDPLVYGASLHFNDIWKGIDTSVYFVQQKVESFTDRQAIGFDLQYQSNNTSIFALLDYDLSFGRISTARISGTRIFADQSSITLSADLTHSPYLTLSNALQGQAVSTLEELNTSFTLNEIEQLALDRTTETTSFTAAYSRPLNEKWRLSVDASAFHTSGSPASGGVAAVRSPGVEFYTSAQLVGSGIYSDSDVVSYALRLADTAQSQLVQFDIYRRFEYNEKLRLKPRIIIGGRNFTRTGGNEYFIIPSLTANYRLNKSTLFEVEIGGRISSLKTPSFIEDRNEFYIFAGFWKEF
jgi:tetratricopeptide (TPR) repeat protein